MPTTVFAFIGRCVLSLLTFVLTFLFIGLCVTVILPWFGLSIKQAGDLATITLTIVSYEMARDVFNWRE